MIMTVVMVLMKESSVTPSIRPAALWSLPARTSNVLEPYTTAMVKMIVVITLMNLIAAVSTI